VVRSVVFSCCLAISNLKEHRPMWLVRRYSAIACYFHCARA